MHRRVSYVPFVNCWVLLSSAALLMAASAQQDAATPRVHDGHRRAIAVLPFHVEGGFGADEAASLNDQLGAQIFNLAAVDVVDPTEVRTAVAESAHDGVCASSCAYAVGDAVGAAFVFGATLTVTDSTCAIAGTVYDVVDRRPLTRVKKRGGTRLHELLDLVKQAARGVAESVAGRRAALADTHTPRSRRRAPPVAAPRPRDSRATLSISSIPAGAQVMLNGSPVGTTPYRSDRVIPGAYDVSLSKSYHETYTRRIVVSQGAPNELAVTLRPEYGSLTVTTDPRGASLVVNDTLLGTTPHTETPLLPGRYAVSLALEGYRPDSSLVTVGRGTHDTLAVQLLSLDSLEAAHSLRQHRRQWGRRLVFGGLGLGFGVAGLIANGQVNDHVSDMEEAAAHYMEEGLSTAEYAEYYEQYTNARTEAEDAATARNWLYGIGGVFGVGFAISIFF